MKRYLLSASCGLLLLTVGPSPVLTLLPSQQDTTAKQDTKDAGTSAKNAAKKTGSATKKETEKVVDGSDAPKKPETTPKQDIRARDHRRKTQRRKPALPQRRKPRKL
jgi:hypothetical protein